MYSSPPHMLYMHPSSNVEPPTSGSFQNPQFCSQPLPSTNPNTCYGSSLSNIKPPSNEVESSIGVDGIQLDEGDQNSSEKKTHTTFLVTEYEQPNIKAILGKDKKNAYNNDYVHQSEQFCERSWTQLKSRWNRIHHPIQKFNGCYKQSNKHRSGSSKKDVLADAHMIYSQDTGKKFEVEHVWLLLKDQPKFDAELMSKC
ncbi:Glutathione S-transferase T2 [Glycine soja]